MQTLGTPEKKMSRTKSEIKQSQGMSKTIVSERMDPKILDNRIRMLLANAKDKLQRLGGEVAGLKKESSDLQEALELSNQQKQELSDKEEEQKAKLQETKTLNEELTAKKNDLEQKTAKAKDELQGLIKLHNQSIKSYTVKLNQINIKEKQDFLKREETKGTLEQQIAQTKKDNDDLRLSITEITRKADSIKELIAQSKEIEQKRLESLSKEAQDLEQLITNN